MKRIVIKIGSSSLIQKNGQINKACIVELVKELSIFMEHDIHPILVTSGAIAVGANLLGEKPRTIGMKQACAALGQASLMHEYDLCFGMYELKCAQILLNHDDFDNRKRMLNLETTLNALIEKGVVPIINENDALAVEEIKVGDNDTLAALIAPMAKANLLVLISDIDGLYNKNPKLYEDAYLLEQVDEINDEIYQMAGEAISGVGTGGMKTKLRAAKIATTSGVDMIIMNNRRIHKLHKAFENHEGTLFKASKNVMKAKNHWVLYTTKAKGIIRIDEGAYRAILSRGSLLAVGIVDVEGSFHEGDVVSLVYDKKEIAKGMVNYNAMDILKLKGRESKDVKESMGPNSKKEIMHANNLVMMEGE